MGRIEVITGPMFSGKTTELLRRLERYIIAGKTCVLLKPAIDTRKQPIRFSSPRATVEIPPLVYQGESPVPPDVSVIALDEAQFFQEGVIRDIIRWRDEGKTVLIAGLDMDFHRRPFGYMGQIMAVADSVTKLTAVCRCGAEAPFTQKLTAGENIIEVGDEQYVAVCGECYQERSKKCLIS